MNKIIQLILAALVAATVSGCASTGGYWSDRGRDAADIFTVTSGGGIGAGARVGPVTASPLLVFWEMAGLRGGQYFKVGELNPVINSNEPHMESFDGGWFGLYGQSFYADSDTYQIIPHEWFQRLKMRGKGFAGECWHKETLALPFFVWAKKMPYRPYYAPDDGTAYPYYYYTQFEAVAAVGGGIRIGFNPGELLDFLMGFAGTDIMGDDVTEKSLKMALEKNQQEAKAHYEKWLKEHPEPSDTPASELQKDKDEAAAYPSGDGGGQKKATCEMTESPDREEIITNYQGRKMKKVGENWVPIHESCTSQSTQK